MASEWTAWWFLLGIGCVMILYAIVEVWFATPSRRALERALRDYLEAPDGNT